MFSLRIRLPNLTLPWGSKGNTMCHPTPQVYLPQMTSNELSGVYKCDRQTDGQTDKQADKPL